ncbi:hypothetical protein NKG05_21980 [Oerskovia sp. M15]
MGRRAGNLGRRHGPHAVLEHPPDDVAAWRAQRTEAAAHQARELERRRERESAEAAVLLREFVAEAGRRGIAPVPLQARAYAGDATYRTGTLGWYLRKNRTLAVGTDGAFYILSVPGGLAARLRGATLTRRTRRSSSAREDATASPSRSPTPSSSSSTAADGQLRARAQRSPSAPATTAGSSTALM